MASMSREAAAIPERSRGASSRASRHSMPPMRSPSRPSRARSRCGAAEAQASARMSALIAIAWLGLLISWATPATSSPREASFSAWISFRRWTRSRSSYEHPVGHVEEGRHDHVAQSGLDLLAEGLDPGALARADAEGPRAGGLAAQQGAEAGTASAGSASSHSSRDMPCERRGGIPKKAPAVALQ